MFKLGIFNTGYSKHKRALHFLVKFSVLVLSWKIFFHVVWHNPTWEIIYNTRAIEIIDVMLHNCEAILELLNFEVQVDSLNRILRIKNTIGVTVGEPCIGIGISAMFIGLIISCGGNILHKIWFIPGGVFLIYILNLIRISSLALLVGVNPYIWDLNHKLFFTWIVYGVIFLLWRVWLKLFDSSTFSISSLRNKLSQNQVCQEILVPPYI